MTGKPARLLFLLPVLALGALVFYLAKALDPDRDPARVASALIDKPAPAIDLPLLETGGGRLTNADFGGEVVLVNFFASWCVPCRIEHPILMELGSKHAVPVFGIAYQDKPEDAMAFLAEFGNPFRRVGQDASGRMAIEFGVYGVPETFVIDKTGRIRMRHAGALDDATVEETLLPLLTELGR